MSEQSAAAEWVDPVLLQPWLKNPRKNDPAVPLVVESIKRFGFAAPIIARLANGEIVAGHTRLRAVLELRREWKRAAKKKRAEWSRTWDPSEPTKSGWHPEALAIAAGGPVPVRYVDLSERDAHLLALADNKLNEKADWDTDLIGEILDDYSLDDAALAGFDADELDRMASELTGGRDRDGEDGSGGDDGDGLLDPTGDDNDGSAPLDTLKFRKYAVQLTSDEASRLDAALSGYVDRSGSLFGFVSALLDHDV